MGRQGDFQFLISNFLTSTSALTLTSTSALTLTLTSALTSALTSIKKIRNQKSEIRN